MKRFTIVLPLVFLAALVLGACFGDRVRERMLVPAVQQSWVEVRANVESGLSVAGLDEQDLFAMQELLVEMDMAVAQGEGYVSWPVLRTYAEKGIKAKGHSPLVEQSLLERLHRFDESMAELN